MRKLCLILTAAYFLQTAVYSQEVFFKKDDFYSEVFLKVDPSKIKAINKDNNKVIIYFKNYLKEPFDKRFDDSFILDVKGEGSTFTVNIKPDSEFSIVNDLKGVKVVATKSKTNSDILSSYGVAKPLLSTESTALEDKNMEDALNNADRLITAKEFGQAAQVLSQILSKTKNEFYRQEALFKLGQTYMLLGQYDSIYYSNAAKTFDDFVRLYPDNFRSTDALLKSAESKELGNQLFEAIKTYNTIYVSVPDLETKRKALKSMAELYKKVGQPEEAINTYLTYLRDFKTDQDLVNSEVGQMYYNMKDDNLAFEYFSLLNLDNLINDPNTSSKRLDAVADVFFKKNRYDQALKLYKAIYEKYPSEQSANNAIFRSAEILQKQNKTAEADALLLKLKEMYPDKESGQRATLEYAEKYINTKPYEYWDKFFSDLLTRPDSYNLHEKARYLLIKTLYKENKIAESASAISQFLALYPESAYKDELNKIREDYLFSNIAESYNKKEMASVEQLSTPFLREYPESQYKPRIEEMLNNIKYNKINNVLKNNDYKSVISFAEAQLKSPDTEKFNDKARWEGLLDDATIKDLNVIFASENYPAARVAARTYLEKFPKGKFRKDAGIILEKAFEKPFNEAYTKLDYPTVIQLYDANTDWLSTWKNKPYVDKIRLKTAMAVYKLGSPTKAKGLYSEITPMPKDKDYALLGLLLGDNNLRTDVNMFDEDTFKYIIGEVEPNNVDMAISLLDKYTKDIKFATGLKYSIAKNVSSDAKRQQILMSIYDTIRRDPKAKFENSEDVYLDIGLIFFRRNDFKNAVMPLKQFVDNHNAKDDKRAEALYYLGKSFVNIGDVQRGYQYYNDIINNIPSSIYAGIAKGEIEDENWRKNLNNY